MGFANFADFTHFADFANFVIYAHFLDYNSFGGWPRPGWLSLKPGRLWPEAWLAGLEAYTTSRAGSPFRGAPKPLASPQTHPLTTPLQPSSIHPSSIYNLDLQILPFFLNFVIFPIINKAKLGLKRAPARPRGAP